MADILPCPFCGGEATLDGKSESCRVRCFACCAEGHMAHLEDADDTDACEDEAIAAWNRRALPPAEAAEMKRLADALEETLPKVGEPEGVWSMVKAPNLRAAAALLRRMAGDQ